MKPAQLLRRVKAFWHGVAFGLGFCALVTTAVAGNSPFTLAGVTLTLTEASDQVDVYYRAMRLNRALQVWNVEVVVSNKSSQTLNGPFVLLIDSFSGTTGPLDADGLDSGVPAKPFYDWSGSVAEGALAPGQASHPRTVTLGTSNGSPGLVTRFFVKPTAAGLAVALTRSGNEAGQPLGGVQVIETGPLGLSTNYTDSTFGVVTLGSASGDYTWQFSLPGFLPVWRQQTLATGLVAIVPYPRLTPRNTNMFPLTPIAGGAITDGSNTVQVTFPPAAFDGNTYAQLTALNGQALPGLLPQGWSPLQAFWLELANEPRAPAQARLLLSSQVNIGENAVLVRWNQTTLLWDVLQVIPGNGTRNLSASLPGSGAYVVAVGDTGVLSPPTPQAGNVLHASPSSAVEFPFLTATGLVQPPVSSASRIPALVTANAQVTISNQNGTLPSGLVLQCLQTETYLLHNGARRVLPQFENYIVAYRRPGNNDSATLQANFPLRPLLLLGADELDTATIHVDVLAPAPFSGALLDNTGGQAAGGDIRILAGAGDILETQAVQIRSLDPTNFTDFATNGVSVLRAFDLTLGGVAAGHHLIARFGSLPANSLFVLARLLSHSGLYGIEPRERLISDARGNLSSLEPSLGEKLPGLTGAGEYLLLQVSAPQDLLTGIAHNTQGQAVGGLAVQLAPWLTFSAADGSYRLISSTGTVSVAVTDLATGDTGQATASVVDTQTPVQANVSTVGIGPSVISVSPAPGATAVAGVNPIIINFSEPVNPGTLLGKGIQLLAGPTNQTVAAQLTLNLNNTTASLLPTDPLAPNTLHTLVLSTNIADLNGRLLTGTNQFKFTTASDSLNRPLGAQVISHEPTNGIAQMEGTQGIADPNAPVILVNETSGKTATVLASPDGSFTNSIAADVNDFLSAVLVNQNGTRTTIPVSRQVFSDGSVALFHGGGALEAEGEDGTMAVMIPPGAIPLKTKFKLETVRFADLTNAVSGTTPSNGALIAGIRLTVHGNPLSAPPTVLFTVSAARVPVSVGTNVTNAVFVAALPKTVGGVMAYQYAGRLALAGSNVVALGFRKTFSGTVGGRKPKGGESDLSFLGSLVGEAFSEGVEFLTAICMDPGVYTPAQTLAINGTVLAAKFAAAQPGEKPKPIPQTEFPLASATVVVLPPAGPGAADLGPGGFFAFTDTDGKYGLFASRGTIIAQSVYFASATHPRFPGVQVAAPIFVPSDASRSAEAQDIIFEILNDPLPDTTPPVIFASHIPLQPAPGQSASLTVRATDDQCAPTLSVTLGSASVAGAPIGSAIPIPGSGPFETANTYQINSPGEGRVTLLLSATDNSSNRRDLTYVINFGGTLVFNPNPDFPPNGANDHTGPYVLETRPADGSQDVKPGDPVIIRFNEPIDQWVLANIPPCVSITPSLLSPAPVPVPSSPGASFQENQRELVLMYPDLQPDASYTVTVQMPLRDVSFNFFDQNPATPALDSYSFTFKTAKEFRTPVPPGLPGVERGSGAVLRGRYAYVLDQRGPLGGALMVYDVEDSGAPLRVPPLVVKQVGIVTNGGSSYPRDLILIPQYGYKRGPNTPAVTNDLLAVVGGLVQGAGAGEEAGQYLRLYNISDPANPEEIAGTLISHDGTAALTRLSWSPPHLAYIENNADYPSIKLIELQSFIYGLNLTHAQITTLPSDRVLGIDSDGNGDFIGPNDTLPIPSPGTLATHGLRSVITLDSADPTKILASSTRFVNDLCLTDRGAIVGAVIGAGTDTEVDPGRLTNHVRYESCYRTFLPGQNLNAAQASIFFPNFNAKRLLVTSDIPWQIGNRLVPLRLAMVCLVSLLDQTNKLAILDVTSPTAPVPLNEILLPAATFGVIQGISRDDGGRVILATETNLLLLDAALLSRPMPSSGPHPAIIGTVPDAASGPDTFSVLRCGLSVSTLGERSVVNFSGPAFRTVATIEKLVDPSDPAFRSDPSELSKLDLLPPLEAITNAQFSAPSTLVPPTADVHFYVLVDAPGAAGDAPPGGSGQILLLLETLDGTNGFPANNCPPMAQAARSQIDEVPAWRVSDDPTSPFYNLFMTRPIAQVFECLAPADLAAINAAFPRTILSANHFFRASLSPKMALNPVLAPYASALRPPAPPPANGPPGPTNQIVQAGVASFLPTLPPQRSANTPLPQFSFSTNLLVKTAVDRLHSPPQVCPGTAMLTFNNSLEALVTITLKDHFSALMPHPLANAVDADTGETVTLFTNIPYASGPHAVLIDSASIGDPGQYDFAIAFSHLPYQDTNYVVTLSGGTILHDVELDASFPIGHTMIDGVDLWDGHLTHSRQDVVIPGRRLSLDFTRTYSSQGDNEEGPLGAGWTHSYNIRLVQSLNCGTFTVIGGEGSGNSFTDSLSETAQAALGALYHNLLSEPAAQNLRFFKPQIGYHSVMVQYKDKPSVVDFFTKSGMRYKFQFEPLLSASGSLETVPSSGTLVYKLLEIREPNGNRLEFNYTYTDNDPRTLDLVAEVDASGNTNRGLVLLYQNAFPNPRISDVYGTNFQTQSDLLGLHLHYAYDGDQNLILVTRDPSGNAGLSDRRVESYTYAPGGFRVGHNMTSYTDPNGSVTRYAYKGSAPPSTAYYLNDLADVPDYEKILTVTRLAHPPGASPDDVVATFEYPSALVRLVHDPREVEPLSVGPSTYTLNAYGATTKIVAPLGQVTEMQWATDVPIPPDAYGRTYDALMTYKKDAEGREHIYEYADGRGNLTKETIRFSANKAPVTLNDGATAVPSISTSYAYDPLFNQRTNVTDAEGHTTITEIDPATGNVQSVTDAEGDITRFHYGQNGDLLDRVDPRSFVTAYANYDIYGNPQQITDGVNNSTTLVYDERSRLIDSSGAFGHHVTFSYDGLDREVREEHLDGLGRGAGPGRTTGSRYLPNGEREYMTNGLGHVTHHFYDGLNRNVSTIELAITNASGSSVDYTNSLLYDHNGNVVQETDFRGIVKANGYDELNRRITATLVSGPAVSPAGLILFGGAYDRVNNLVAETNLHGFATTYRHDGLYRVVETHLPLSAAPAILLTAYDRVGNKVIQTDANGNPTHMLYDRVYRLVRQTDPLGNIVTNTYDLAGNKVLEQHLSSGLVVETPSAAIDGLNRPTLVRRTVPLGGPGLSTAIYETHATYDDAANTVHGVNPRGFMTTTVKDGLDRTYQVIVNDGAGGGAPSLTTTYKYDGNANVTEVYDPQSNDRDLFNEYDGLNRKVRITYLAGVGDSRSPVTEEWLYDQAGNVTQYTDKRGIVFTSIFDNLNRVLEKHVIESISNGRNDLKLMACAYNDGANTVGMTDANGNPTTILNDELGRPKVTTDALGQTLANQYDGVNKIGMTDKKGQSRAYQYDGINRLKATQESDISGAVQSRMFVQYLDNANQHIETDRNGYRTISQFDALGRLVQKFRSDTNNPSPAGSLAALYGADPLLLETHEYDGNNNLTSSLDGGGNRTIFVYDGADRKVALIEGANDPNVVTTNTYTFDNVGNLLSVTEVHNGQNILHWRNGYDARYRKTAATNGENNVTLYSYDENNNLTSMTEPVGVANSALSSAYTTRYLYDELSKLMLVDERTRGGGPTIFQYDNNRNKTSQQDANTNLVTYNYDALNRLTLTKQHTNAGALTVSSLRTDNPGGGVTPLVWQFAYDPNNNQSFIKDPRGQSVSLGYDWLDRLTNRTYSGHAETDAGVPIRFQPLALDYGYDLNGNLTSAVETKAGLANRETNSMVYDALNRVFTRTRVDYDGALKTITNRYDIQGNRAQVGDPDGFVTAYTFDSRNRLSTATTHLGQPDAGTTTYTWWEDSLLKQVEYPNGAICDRSTANSYDAAQRVTQIVNRGTLPAPTTFSTNIYQYDPNGNRTNQVEFQAGLGRVTETTTYTYDNLNRLANVTYGLGGALAYTYEPNGNRLTETGTDPVTGAAVNRLYVYTPTGPGTFDHVNALSRIQDLTPAALTVDYAYDANLNQTSRTQSGVSRGFRYDIRDQIIETSQDQDLVSFDYNFDRLRVKKIHGADELRYLYDQSSVLVEYDATPAHASLHKYNYGYSLLSLTRYGATPQINFYHTDGLGSTIDLSDNSGGLSQSYRYDAWGRLRAQSGTSDNLRQYTGHYRDTETGLQYFGARYYDEEQGRFLSQDPYLGQGTMPPSLHRFSYAYDNPLRFLDLTGYKVTMTTEGPPEPRAEPNSVIDPETGEEHRPWWLGKPKTEEQMRKEMVEEDEKALERKKTVDQWVAPLNAHLDKAEAARGEYNENRAEEDQIHEEPGAYERYLYEQAGGPLANRGFQDYPDMRPTPSYINGSLVGYERMTEESHEYYDTKGNQTHALAIAGAESDLIQFYDLISFGHLGVSMGELLLTASAKFVTREIVEALAGRGAGLADEAVTRVSRLSEIVTSQMARNSGVHRDFDLLARTAAADVEEIVALTESGKVSVIRVPQRLLPPGARGYIDPKDPTKVYVGLHLDIAQYIATAFHEVSHAHSLIEHTALGMDAPAMSRFMDEFFADLSGIRAEIHYLGIEGTAGKSAQRLALEQGGIRGVVEDLIGRGYGEEYGLARQQILEHFESMGLFK